MADVSPAQALSSLTNGNHLRQKRARSQLSCKPCRTGKLKCNRSHDPACDQCIKRNREGQCVYLPPPTKQKPTQNVKGRIRQLETLVVELMNAQTHKNSGESETGHEDHDANDESQTAFDSNIAPYSEPTPPSDNDSISRGSLRSQPPAEAATDVDDAAKPFGQMKISKHGTSYVGDSHWKTILDGISELKRDLGEDDNGENDDDEYENEHGASVAPTGHPAMHDNPHLHHSIPGASTPNGLGFMLGRANAMSKEELIAAVPEKRITDRLLSLWFNSPDPFKCIIHAPTFQEEYRAYWKDPKSVSCMWLGLLFAILSLASSFGLRDIDPQSPAAQTVILQTNKYHSLAASAAVLGEFTKPRKYTIECLIFYAAGLRSNDAFVNVWLMIGLVIRLALRMGYHRDPSSYRISAFDGEMRRRIWAIISMIDVLISFQLGLPSMVKTIHSDTQAPRNLLDRDFNKSSKTLPESRSIDELTPCSYVRAKLQLIRVFADATELSHATTPPTYEEMMALDARLEEAKARLPPLLSMPEITELVTDPAEQLMCRFNLDLLYLKTKIIIHRRYMSRPFASLTPREQEIGIGHSRRMCVDSALRVLRHHHTLYAASQPGGQMESVKWYMGSLSTHDFLLAAMVICLELSQQINNDPILNPGGRHCTKRMQYMEALEKSQKIWSEASGRTKSPVQFIGTGDKTKAEHLYNETEKASRAMAVMVEKVKKFSRDLADRGAEGSELALQPCQSITEIPSSLKPTRESFPPHAHLVTPLHVQPFSGALPNYDWANMAGVPDQLYSNETQSSNSEYHASFPPTASSGATSQNVSHDNSPDSGMLQVDYAMLGDVLDIQDNFDWEMLDGALQGNKEGQARFTAGSLPIDINPIDFNTSETMLIGNAITGGSGTVRFGTNTDTTMFDDFDPATIQQPTSSGNLYPGSWMAFPEMSNVDYSV